MKNNCKITFIKKLVLVLGVRQFCLGYLFPAFLLSSISTLLVISGIFAENYLWLSGLLLIISIISVCIIIKHGVNKIWKDMFE